MSQLILSSSANRAAPYTAKVTPVNTWEEEETAGPGAECLVDGVLAPVLWAARQTQQLAQPQAQWRSSVPSAGDTTETETEADMDVDCEARQRGDSTTVPMTAEEILDNNAESVKQFLDGQLCVSLISSWATCCFYQSKCKPINLCCCRLIPDDLATLEASFVVVLLLLIMPPAVAVALATAAVALVGVCPPGTTGLRGCCTGGWCTPTSSPTTAAPSWRSSLRAASKLGPSCFYSCSANTIICSLTFFSSARVT